MTITDTAASRFTTHDTMVLTRHFAAERATVFAAWASATAKRGWFTGSATDDGSYTLDFRVGGHETSRGGPAEGADVYTYDAEYRDIVEDARIVYTNHMSRNDTRISVSLTTVEFGDDDGGTLLTLTEYGVYLDGEDKPEYRTAGIGAQLDALGRMLEP